MWSSSVQQSRFSRKRRKIAEFFLLRTLEINTHAKKEAKQQMAPVKPRPLLVVIGCVPSFPLMFKRDLRSARKSCNYGEAERLQGGQTLSADHTREPGPNVSGGTSDRIGLWCGWGGVLGGGGQGSGTSSTQSQQRGV